MEPGSIYHLYNHANGYDLLFKENADYELFLKKIVDHTSMVAKFYAFCLMSNHFHLLVEMKSDEELSNVQGHLSVDKKISRSFANAFSGYTQKINHKYDRMGSLFIPNIGRREILDENDFCNTCHYIHANPVHHGFSKFLFNWPYSSYSAIINQTLPWLDRETVLDYFGGLNHFIQYHQRDIDLKIKEKTYF